MTPNKKTNGYGDMPCGNGSGDAGKIYNGNAESGSKDALFKSEGKVPPELNPKEGSMKK